MDARFQRRIQRYGWDKAASCYEQFWSAQIAPAQEKLLEMAALRPGERVVDVACGTGLVSFEAAEAVGPSGRVVGTDIAEKMVESAAVLAASQGFVNTQFARMDAEELELDDGTFDAALCSLGLMYFPDPVKSLAEMRRALKPGGRAAAVVWGERRRCGWAGIFPAVDARVQSEVCPMFFQLGTGNSLEQAFLQAGFGDVLVHRLQTNLHYDTAADACGAAFAGGPVALAYSRFDDKTREEAHAEYLESIEPYRTASGYNIPGEFVIATGRKN